VVGKVFLRTNTLAYFFQSISDDTEWFDITYYFVPGAKNIFSSLLIARQNKLQCLYQLSLFRLTLYLRVRPGVYPTEMHYQVHSAILKVLGKVFLRINTLAYFWGHQ
jgi:hypothetical protein